MPNETIEPGAYKRGPGGRPTRQEAERRHQCLLASATRMFLEKGWDGASVDEISRHSGVAKRFIYARYPSKAALFVGAVERFIGEKMEILQGFEPLPEDAEEGLYSFGRKLLDLALQPDTLAFLRLFIAEAPRFPRSREALCREHPPSRSCQDHARAGGLCRPRCDRTWRSRDQGGAVFYPDGGHGPASGLARRPRGARRGRPEAQSGNSFVLGGMPDASKSRIG